MKRIGLACFMALAISGTALGEVDVRKAIEQLVLAGEFDRARSILTAVHGSPDDRLLLEADIAVTKGDFGGAIKIYRSLVTKYPNNLMLRKKLVDILIADRNATSAKYHLDELARRVDDPQIKSYFTQKANEISQYDAFGVSGSFSITPSSNINGASDQATGSLFGREYDIPDELLPQFGWRASLGMSAFAKARIADNQELVLRGKFSAQAYTVPTLDQATAEVSVGWEYGSARNSVSITPYLQRKIGDGQSYQIEDIFGVPTAKIIERNEDSWVGGLRLYMERRYKKSRSFFVAAQYSHEIYDDENLDYAENERASLRLGYSFLVNPRNRGTVWVAGQTYTQVGNGSYSSPSNYKDLSIGASLETVFSQGIRTKFSLEHGKKTYELPPYFTFVDYVREDNITTLGLEMSNQNWMIGKFAPVLSCQYSITNSNFDQYTTDGGSCGVSLTQSF